MAIDVPNDKGLSERELARFAGGQGSFADPFGSALLDLLGQASALGDDLRFGAVLDPADGMFSHQNEDGEAIAVTPSATFKGGKPVVTSVSQDPADGSTREITARYDASGALLQTEETRTISEGPKQIETRKVKAGDGSELEKSVTERESAADGTVTTHRITTRADGSTRDDLTQADADGNVLNRALTDVARDGSKRVEELKTEDDGSQRKVTTLTDAQGAITDLLDVVTGVDGSKLITEIRNTPLGSHEKVVQEDLAGNVLDSHGIVTLKMPDATGTQLLDTLITYRADGQTTVQLRRRDTDGTLLETLDIEPESPSAYGGRTQWASIPLTESSTLDMYLYFRAANSEEKPDGGEGGGDEEGPGSDENAERNTGPLRLDSIQLSHSFNDGNTFARKGAWLHADGSFESNALERLTNGDEIETLVTHHVDGSKTVDERTHVFGGDDLREAKRTAADGRLLEEVHGHKVRNGDFTETTTVYHEDGSTHETFRHDDRNWNPLELTKTLTFANGSQTIESETYPGGGKRTVLAQKDASGMLLDERIMLVRPDESHSLETRTYHADGRYEAFLEERSPDGTLTSTTETLTLPTADGGKHTRTFETITGNGTVEFLLKYDADDVLIQKTRTGTNPDGVSGNEFETWAPDGSYYRRVHFMTNAAGEVIHPRIEKTVETAADGQRKTQETDYNADGSTVRNTEIYWQDRDQYETSRVETRPLADGQQRINATTWYGYYSGNKIESEIIQASDGTVLTSTTTETRPGGQVVTNIRTPQSDGSILEEVTSVKDFRTTTATITTAPDGSQSVLSITKDADDRILREEAFHVAADRTVHTSSVTEYSGGFAETTHTTLDPNGKPQITRERRNAQGVLVSTYESVTSPDGILRVSERYFTDGALSIESVKRTDPDGNELESISTIVDNDPVKGETVQIVSARPGGLQDWEITTTKDGQVTARETRQYTPSGRTIQTWRLNPDGSTYENLDRWNSDDKRTEYSSTETSVDAGGVQTVERSHRREDGSTHNRVTRTAADGTVLSDTDILSQPDGSRVHDEMTLQANGSVQRVSRNYGPGASLKSTTTILSTRDPDGQLSVSTFVEHADGSWRQEDCLKDEDGTTLSLTVTESRRETDENGNQTLFRTVHQPDGSRFDLMELRDSALTLIERRETLHETDPDGIETSRTEVTRQDGSTSEITTTRHPDGLVERQTIDRQYGGTTITVETRQQGALLLETVRTEEKLEANGDRRVDTLTTRSDGSSEASVVVTHAPGVATTTETVTASDNSRTVRTTETRYDGTRHELFERFDVSGALIDQETRETAKDGTSAHTVTTPQSDGAIVSFTTRLTANGVTLETLETRVNPDASKVETRLKQTPDGSTWEEQKTTNATGGWVSTRLRTTFPDQSQTIETRTPADDGAIRTIFVRKDASNQDVESYESLTRSWTDTHGLSNTSILTTQLDGSTREVLTLSHPLNGKILETTITETSLNDAGHTVTRIVTTRATGITLEEHRVKDQSDKLVSFDSVETYFQGSTFHHTETRGEDGSTRVEEGQKSPDGTIVTWKSTQTIPRAEGGETVTIITQNGDFSIETETFTRDANGNESERTVTTSTRGNTTTTEDLPDGSKRETTLYKAADGETLQESRVTTVGANGKKLHVEIWQRANDLRIIESYDETETLRSRDVSETRANGHKQSVVSTYGADGKLLTEVGETRSASNQLLASREVRVTSDGHHEETWRDETRAPGTYMVFTRKDADGNVLATRETESRVLADGSSIEKLREANEDGTVLKRETHTAKDGAELRDEAEWTDADGTKNLVRREKFADGASQIFSDQENPNGTARQVITYRDANGVETVETVDYLAGQQQKRVTIVTDPSGALLSETEFRRDAVKGLIDRSRTYGAEGYRETITERWPDGTNVETLRNVNANGKLLHEASTKRSGDIVEQLVTDYDATGRLLRKETQSYNRMNGQTESVVTDHLPGGGQVIVTTTKFNYTESVLRVEKDDQGEIIERFKVTTSTTYHRGALTNTFTRTEERPDGTVFVREELRYLSGAAFEWTETLTDVDGSQTSTRRHGSGSTWQSGSDFVSKIWTETVTRKSSAGDILETDTTKFATQQGGALRQDRLITRQDGSTVTDFRVLSAEGDVLEFRTVTREPKSAGEATFHTEAAFRDGRILVEDAEQSATGQREIVATTTWPNGDRQVVESLVAADETILERKETFERAEDGVTTVRITTNTLHGSPATGTLIEKEQVYDAADTLTRETTLTTFANGSRFETSYTLADGEASRTQAEYEEGGRRLYDFRETHHANGHRTVVTSKEHIDGSVERIEVRLDASNQRVAFAHTLVDSMGKTFLIEDPHTPTVPPTLVSVQKKPMVTVNRHEYEETVYTYSDGTIVREEKEFAYWYSVRERLSHVKRASKAGNTSVIYEQKWLGGSGLIDRPRPLIGSHREVGAGGFTTIDLSGNASGQETIQWNNAGQWNVVVRNSSTKNPIRSGYYTLAGRYDYAFHFESADGLRVISGMKDYRGNLSDPYSETGLLRSTETILDPAAGTKTVIERAPGPDGHKQVAEMTYTVQDDGTQIRKSSRVTTTFSDRSQVIVERLFDDQGAIAHEKHHYRNPSGKHVMETEITHLGKGASDSRSTHLVDGKVHKVETVKTRVSLVSETVETRTYDGSDKLIGRKVAVTTLGNVQVTTTYHPSLNTPQSVETALVSKQTHPDGRVEKVYKSQTSDTVTTLRWGPSGEYAGGSKVHTSSDGKLVTTEVFTPEGNKTITLIEKENGKITAITTSHLDPFGRVSNVSRAENLNITDPLSQIAADKVMGLLGFSFKTNPDGSKSIDFSKRVAGVPFTVEGLDFSKIGLNLDDNPLEPMADAFKQIIGGNASPENYAKLIGSLALTVRQAKGNPGVMAGYLAFSGIDLALKETPFGQQWMSIKRELNGYLDSTLQGGMFGGVDVTFKLIDSLAGGAASKWLKDNGLGNALDALSAPNVLLGTPGEMVSNLARTLATGGAYAPVKMLYNMMPDGVQRAIDDALAHVPGYSEVSYGLGLATGYIDDGVQTGLRYAHEYAQKGFQEAFNAQNYVIAAEALVSLSEDFASYTTTYAKHFSNAMTSAYGAVEDVTKDFANLMSDIGSQGIAMASRLANEVYGGLKSIGNAIADGAETVWNGAKDAAKEVASWFGF